VAEAPHRPWAAHVETRPGRKGAYGLRQTVNGPGTRKECRPDRGRPYGLAIGAFSGMPNGYGAVLIGLSLKGVEVAFRPPSPALGSGGRA